MISSPVLEGVPVSERIAPADPREYLRTAVAQLCAAFGENLVGVALYGSRARVDARMDKRK